MTQHSAPAQLDYVGRNAKGQVVCWCSSSSERKDIARTISEWVRSGLEVCRMTTDDARDALSRTLAERKSAATQEEMPL